VGIDVNKENGAGRADEMAIGKVCKTRLKENSLKF